MRKAFGCASLLFHLLIWTGALGFALWASGAFHYDLPGLRPWAAPGFILVLLVLAIFLRGAWKKLAAVVLASLAILAWWLTQRPSNDRPWQPDLARTAWADIRGDEVTLHNVRNTDYRTATDLTPRWETRTLRLSEITGIDMAICYWGSPWMAHPIASFQFADAPPVCFSIETRKEIGEKYSAIGGIYRQYELIYVVADERDAIRVRSNLRKDEDVFLYRLKISPEKARERFMDYLTTLNELNAQARWYNAVTTNCTTSIRTQHAATQRAAWDWRMLVNGKADEMLYERGAFHTGGLAFPQLRAKARINEAARLHDSDPDFSIRIRENRPGFEDTAASLKAP